MNIPKLQPNKRKNPYKFYNIYERSLVVKEFLFNGAKHRNLDQEILNLDPKKSLGFQSMGILHHLGLKEDFQGIFKNQNLDYIINMLVENNQDFELILKHLNFL